MLETLAVGDVAAARGLRYQRLDREPAQLVEAVAEQRAGSVVGTRDAAVGVDDQHRIRVGIEDRMPERGGVDAVHAASTGTASR
jgi:hypothetical protein